MKASVSAASLPSRLVARRQSRPSRTTDRLALQGRTRAVSISVNDFAPGLLNRDRDPWSFHIGKRQVPGRADSGFIDPAFANLPEIRFSTRRKRPGKVDLVRIALVCASG